MRSGFLSGFFWGSVLALAVLVSVSLSLPLDLVRMGPEAGGTPGPVATAPAMAPATAPEAETGAPATGAEAPVPTGEAAVKPEAAEAPETPEAPAVAASEEAAGVPGASEVAPESGPEVAGETGAAGRGAVPLPEVPAGSEFRRARDDTSPSAPRIEPSTRAAEPAAPAGEATLAEAPPAADTAPPEMPRLAATQPQRPETPPAAEGEGAPRIVASPAPSGATTPGRVPPGAIGLPVPDVAAPTAGAPASRLPQIETAPSAPATPAAEGGETEVAVTPPEEAPLPGAAEEGAEGTAPPSDETANIMEELDLGALSANSVPFENPEAKPLMAVVLLDLGDKGIDTEVLKTFAFPVTFAIDPEAPGAAERAVELRAAGFEVVAVASGLMGLKGAGTPLEVDTLVRDEVARLTTAVALMEPAPGAIQGNMSRAETLVGVLAETGHGLLLFDKGLNSGLQMAARSGVPAVTIYRDLDAQNEKAPTIQRYLDRAAFKAGQDGQVVVLGRTRAETVKALFAWALGGRAQTVAFAPLSAILMAQ